MATIAPTTDTLLDSLNARHAPVATVVVEAPDASEDAARRLDIRTRAIRSDLVEAGLPEAVVDGVVEALTDHRLGSWIGVVADPTGVVATPLVDPDAEVVDVDALPRYVPFLRDRFEHRPHVVVRCDRTGAEIARVVRGEVTEETVVDGDDVHVQKVKTGGWSQARMQRHAEHTWDDNAQDIASAVVSEAEAARAELVVVTGDLRAVGMVGDHLPEHWRDRTLFDDTEPSDEADTEAVFDRAATLVRDHAAREVVALLERFAERRGRDDGAAEGVDEVFTALRRGAVETLLVTRDVGEDVHASSGEPMQLARDESTLADLGFDDVVAARLTDAAIRAALAGGAEVVVVPEHGPDAPDGPLGAILRY